MLAQVGQFYFGDVGQYYFGANIKPTNKPVEWLGSALFSFEGEKVADLWVLGDVHGLLQLLEKNANG